MILTSFTCLYTTFPYLHFVRIWLVYRYTSMLFERKFNRRVGVLRHAHKNRTKLNGSTAGCLSKEFSMWTYSICRFDKSIYERSLYILYVYIIYIISPNRPKAVKSYSDVAKWSFHFYDRFVSFLYYTRIWSTTHVRAYYARIPSACVWLSNTIMMLSRSHSSNKIFCN